MARKKQILTRVTLTGMADKGRCIGRDPEGRIVFVENTAPGDIADVLITRKKKGVAFASPLAFHHFSEDRTAPICSHFGVCGGCKWQHIAYEAQLKYKEVIVKDAFERIAKVSTGEFFPILGCDSIYEYRNKLEYTFSNKKWLTKEEISTEGKINRDALGFHRPGSFDKIVNIDHCHLQREPTNKIRNEVKEYCSKQGWSFYDYRENQGFLRNLIVRTAATGEIMLIVVFGEDRPTQRDKFLSFISEKFAAITSLFFVINNKMNDSIHDLKAVLYKGKDHLVDFIGDVKYRIGPKSFFQTNTHQAKVLYDQVLKLANLNRSETVYDLYCGAGTIGLYMAEKCRMVVGIEQIPEAIEDAHMNVKLNSCDNAVFHVGDVKDVLGDAFRVKYGLPDLIVTDPPRAGMHRDVCNTLLQLSAPRMVYVSCNPGTQARDIAILSEKYRVTKVQPIDMFPHTNHIENIALLELR